MARSNAATRLQIDSILRDRILASVELIVRMMPAAAKAEAARSPDVSSLVLNLARGLPSTETGDPRLRETVIAAAEFKRRLLKAAGGALKAADVRDVLRHKSLQAVYKAVKERRLLMVGDNGTQLFPLCQFHEGVVLAAIPLILAAAPRTDGWGILQFLVSGDQGLGVACPMDLIKGGEADIARVVRFARTLED